LEGDIEEAGALSEACLSLGGKNCEVFCAKALVSQARGEHVRAREALDKALEVEPDSSRAYHQYGKLVEGSGQFDYAEKLYQKAIQAAPHDVDALVSYSEMLIRKIDSVYFHQESSDYDLCAHMLGIALHQVCPGNPKP